MVIFIWYVSNDALVLEIVGAKSFENFEKFCFIDLKKISDFAYIFMKFQFWLTQCLGRDWKE